MNLKYKYSITYFIAIIAGKLLRLFPLKFNVIASKLFIRLVYPLLNSRKKVAINNLKAAFPDYDDEQIKKIAYKSIESLGITFMELFYLPKMSREEVMKYVKFENPELLINLYKEGRGLLLLSAHYGNWEFMAFAGAYHLNIDMLIPVKLLKNWFVDRMVNKIRTANGNKIVNMDRAAFEMLKQLKSGKAVALLADQSAQEDTDVFVSLFNRPTLTYKAPAELALKYNIPLTINFCERQDDGSYIIKSEEVKHDDLELNRDAILELTQRHVSMLEKQLIKNPEQWAWAHKRWKHQPKNEMPNR